MKAIAKKSLACIVVMAMLLVNAVIVSAAGETDQNFGQKAYSFLQEINALGARIAGSEQEIQAKDMLVNELETAGYENVEVQPFTYTRGGKTTNSQNVVVTKPGDSEKQIIIGAHYDSVQKTTEVDGVFSTGVDDNGSGTSVTLEAALRMIGVDTKYTLKFVFFGAEETGLQGSKAYVKSMSQEELDNTVLMINLDSILAGDKMYIYGGVKQSGGTVKDTWAFEQSMELVKELGLDIHQNPGKNSAYPAPSTGDWSDHASFKNVGIPYVYFEAGNWDLPPYDGSNQTELLGEIMHTKYDRLEAVESYFGDRGKEHLAAFSELLYHMLLNIDASQPVITGAPVSGAHRASVKLTADKDVSWSVNGVDTGRVGKAISFTQDGDYTVVATDKYGIASDPVVFSIDRVKPVLASEQAANQGYTNQDVTLTATEDVQFVVDDAAVDGYTDSITVTEPGRHVVKAYDKAGNYSGAYVFTIDKKAPVLSTNFFILGGVTRYNVAVTSDERADFYINGELADENALRCKFTTPGVYEVKAVDAAGNESNTIAFEIKR